MEPTFHQNTRKINLDDVSHVNIDNNFAFTADSQPAGIEQFAPEVTELRIDVISKPTTLILIAQLPGVKKEEVDIVVDNDLLKIRAHKLSPIDVSDADNMLASECDWGETFRPVILPKGLDLKKVSASMDLGVLRVEIPKTDDMKIRKIKIA